jgi:hypothetical protein
MTTNGNVSSIKPFPAAYNDLSLPFTMEGSMRKSQAAAVFGATLCLCWTMSAKASDFYFAGSSDADHIAIIDPSTISAAQNGHKTFHLADISSYTLWIDFTMEVDCGSERWQLVSAISHLAGGSTMDFTSRNPNVHVWKTLDSGSNDMLNHDLVCQYPDKKPTGDNVLQFADFQSALEAVSNVIVNHRKNN